VYRYRRRPLLLVQVNIENKDILCIYTSNHGQYLFNCLFLLIPATNLDDTNLVMVNICPLVGSMCHASQDRNNIFESCYIPV
jgi:hypothetical protein